MSKDSLAKYYQNNKKMLIKDIKVLLGCGRYQNLPQDEKQKLVEYRKKYYKMREIVLL